MTRLQSLWVWTGFRGRKHKAINWFCVNTSWGAISNIKNNGTIQSNGTSWTPTATKCSGYKGLCGPHGVRCNDWHGQYGAELHCLLAVMECQYKLTDDSCNSERKLPATSNWSSPCNLHLSYSRLRWANPALAFLSHVTLLSVLRSLLINYGPILNFHKIPQHTTAAMWLINQNVVLDTTEPSLFNVLEKAGLVFLRGKT